MNEHIEQIAALEDAALAFEQQPADAAALLLDVAALCAVRCGLSVDKMIDRLSRSYNMLSAASEAATVHGKAWKTLM